MVDSELSKLNENEVKRIIRVALLCTQTSPTLRPSMSRVVPMLLGDIEVSTEILRPGYLNDWKFDDTSSLLSDIATKGTDSTFYVLSTNMSILGDAMPLPSNGTTRSMLHGYFYDLLEHEFGY